MARYCSVVFTPVTMQPVPAERAEIKAQSRPGGDNGNNIAMEESKQSVVCCGCLTGDEQY